MSDNKQSGRKKAIRKVGPPAKAAQKQQEATKEPEYESLTHGGLHTMQGLDLTEPLPEPGPIPQGAMRLVALGGVSEVGRNMMTYEYDGKLLIVDCGVLFPSSTEPGIDLILPDFSYIEDRLNDVEALVLTHGHEDHIGAIPFLLKLRPDIPIIGSAFTNALIKAKCEEHRLRPNCIDVTEASVEKRGDFTVEFFTVNHSIPGALGIVIKTPAGVAVQSGDIKVDQLPKDGCPTDLPKLSRFGDEGIDLFLLDSTNATRTGLAASEAHIEPNIRRLIQDAQNGVVVSCFASNVTRVQIIADAARAAGRKIVLLGRSMERNMGIAREMGLLNIAEENIVAPEHLKRHDPADLVIVTTGTQGEMMAGLSRMARGEHRQVTLQENDMVIMSSSTVPGNEEAVYGMLNTLSQRGITVVTDDDVDIHVSGHGYATDLLFLYNAARPKNVMPVHGEFRHLRANKELALATGVAPERVILAPNGVCVDLRDGEVALAGQIPVGNLYVDGLSTGDVGEDVLHDRSILGEEGFIAATVVVDRISGKPLTEPQVIGKGFTDELHALDQVPALVEEALVKLAEDGENDPYRMAQTVRRTVGKWVAKKWRRRPMIVPTVVTADPNKRGGH